MKKIAKILFVFALMIANKEILNAEEVRYKFFKNVDDSVHYEYNPEETCNSFEGVDYDDFIYGDYQYSLIKPEEKEGRIITKEVHNLELDRHAINIMQVKKFNMTGDLLLTEFEVLDKDGNTVNYTIDHFYFQDGVGSTIADGEYSTNVNVGMFSVLWLKFSNPLDILNASYKLTYLDNGITFQGLDLWFYIDRDLMVEVFDIYNEIIDTSCSNGICTSTIKPHEGRISYNEININSNVYKYKDRKYKCYTSKREYLPGYYSEVQGYTKDENDFIKVEDITKEELEEVINNSNKEISILSNKVNSLLSINSELTSKLDDVLTKVNSIKEVNSNDNNIIKLSSDKVESTSNIEESNDTFYIISSVLMLILIILLVIKNIKRYHD